MKIITGFLFLLPLCIATSNSEDDNGYERLCSKNYNCICPYTRSETYLDCKQLNIKTLPKNIYFPVKIDAISFQGNEISNIVFNNFYNGHAVKFLDLSYNNIGFIASSSFVAFEQLNELYLAHNELTSLPVNLLDGLKKLKVLDLSFNKLQNFLSNVFEDTPHLIELKLKFNPLIYLDDISFQHLPMLEKLELESTGLNTLPSDLFSYTPHLKTLSLASNQFTDIPTGALQKATELKQLDISENLLQEVKPHAFYGLINLAVLYMNRQNNLINIREEAFCDLINLRALQCSYNENLMDIDINAFRRNNSKVVPPLEQLHIRENALEYISENLLPWRDIAYVDFRGNPWKCDCHLKWMADVHPQQKYQENIRCASPPNLRDIPLSKLSAEDFVCRRFYFSLQTLPYLLIVLMLILVGLSFILALTILCYRKFAKSIKIKRQRQYTLIIPKVDKIDLEWDHSADP